MRNLFRNGVKLGTLVLVFALIGGWFQSVHPAMDSLSHFRLHFAGLLAGAALLLGCLRKWQWAFSSLLVVLVSIMLTWPYLPGLSKKADAEVSSQEGKLLRIVQMNLRFNNPTPELATAAIRTGNSDIVLLQEVTRKTQSVMSDLKDRLPHQISCQIRGVGSVAILSRFPFANPALNKCARFFGYATATVNIDGKPLALASFHSKWPWPRGQKRQIDNLESEFRSLKPPLIVAGDFNSAPWSAAVQRVARMTGTRVFKGLMLTWAPRFVEFKTTIGALLPLDQLLVSPQFDVVERKRLQDGGSDHFPILTVVKTY